MFENSVELELEAKVQGNMGHIELDCIVFKCIVFIIIIIVVVVVLFLWSWSWFLIVEMVCC